LPDDTLGPDLIPSIPADLQGDQEIYHHPKENASSRAFTASYCSGGPGRRLPSFARNRRSVFLPVKALKSWQRSLAVASKLMAVK
jgi:hypothetical protein